MASTKKRRRHRLWAGIYLGKWDPDRFCELFTLYGTGRETDRDRDDYARQLMILVVANFRRRDWFTTADRLQICVDDVAADLVQHLLRKTPTAQAKIEHPCNLVVRMYVTRMLHNRMLSIIRRQQNVLARLPKQPVDAIGEDCVLDRATGACGPADLGRLAAYLRGHEDEACRGVRGDIFAITTLFRYMCRRLVRAGDLVQYRGLPERLRSRVDAQTMYLPMVVRLRSLVERAAADAVG